jgi:GTPase SAR1 family protein
LETTKKLTMVLVGNKSDLESEHVVDNKKIENFIYSKIGYIKYIETSAHTGKKVEQAFKDLTDIIFNLKEHQKIEQQNKKSQNVNLY